MITSEQELLEKINELKKAIPNENLLLFRGQTDMYDQMRSGKSRPNPFVNAEIENGWNTVLGRIIHNKEASSEYRQSILQHYGYPTFYLDLTDDPLVAGWFATNKYVKLEPMRWVGGIGFRQHDRTTYEKIDTGIGYFYILEIINYEDLIDNNILYDLNSEDLFLRPQKQSAYLMLDKVGSFPNPNNFVMHIWHINRSVFKSKYKLTDLFPHPAIDVGYNQLLDVPFIKKPFDCELNFTKMSEEEILNLTAQDYYLNDSKRIIDIPLYIEDINGLFNIKPKTKDIILFEPRVFRNWKSYFEVNVSQFHTNVDTMLNKAKRISISPDAFNQLLKNPIPSQQLCWPQIDSDSILFTITDIEHDVAGHEGPPYWGLWLCKKGNIIIELDIIVTNDTTDHSIGAGCLYRLDTDLKVYTNENEKTPNDIEDRIKIIKALLSIHKLNKNSIVSLLPNPFEIEDWFVLF